MHRVQTKLRSEVLKLKMLGNLLTLEVSSVRQVGQMKKKKALQTFTILKPIWRRRAIRTATKIRIFNSNVKSVLLYGSETWRSTAASTKTIQVLINRCLRNITGIKWPEKISNKNLWKMTKQEPVMQTITTRKWRWISPTLRKKNTNVTRHALEWNPQGNRKRGIPKKSFARGKEDRKNLGRTEDGCKRQEEMESSSYRPMSSLGRSGLSK